MEFKISKVLARDQYLTATTQILVSVSLFYIIFFHSSPRFPFLLRSLKIYLSAIPLHHLDKRWVFLICNGILVILANTSGLVSFPSSVVDQNDHKIGHDHHHLHAPVVRVLLLESAEQAGNSVTAELDYENNDEETNEKDEADHHHHCCGEEEQLGDNLGVTMEEDHEEVQIEPPAAGQGEDIRIDITEDDEENENYDSEGGFDPLLEEEEEEEEVEAVQGEEEEGILLEKLSAEELNKKFEDFIRKMKEELRIEAQQQHLVVVK